MTLQSDFHSAGDSNNAPFALADDHAKTAYNAAGDAFRSESQGHTPDITKKPQTLGTQAKLLGEGLLTGCLLNPINSVGELASCAGLHLPKLELANQDEVDHSWAGKIGSVAGSAADFVLTAGAASAAFGLEASSIAAMGTAGAVNGGLLTPTGEQGSAENVLSSHLKNAAVAGGSGMVMGAVAGKVESKLAGSLGDSAASKVAVRGFAGAVGGTTSGVVRAETKSILQSGEFAPASELAQQMVGGAVGGMAGKVQGALDPAVGNTVVGSITASSLVSATGGAAGEAAHEAVVKKQNPDVAQPELLT